MVEAISTKYPGMVCSISLAFATSLRNLAALMLPSVPFSHRMCASTPARFLIVGSTLWILRCAFPLDISRSGFNPSQVQWIC